LQHLWRGTLAHKGSYGKDLQSQADQAFRMTDAYLIFSVKLAVLFIIGSTGRLNNLPTAFKQAFYEVVSIFYLLSISQSF
jgi:hypothetical protein